MTRWKRAERKADQIADEFDSADRSAAGDGGWSTTFVPDGTAAEIVDAGHGAYVKVPTEPPASPFSDPPVPPSPFVDSAGNAWPTSPFGPDEPPY